MPPDTPTEAGTRAGLDFIRAIVAEDLASGRVTKVVTRFPPEPNGYLHIGHTKAITLNWGIAQENGGVFNLRFDDTNPETEDMAYVRAILEDVRWLGAEPGERVFFASDYFPQMYEFALHLIRTGHAYVDSQDEEEIRENRGTVTAPGRDSPYRDRSVEESLDLFQRMRAGEFANGAHVLRGRIDMASPNMLLRDPILYRIRHASHYRTGEEWPIYPLYDYAHPIEDAIEGVTHSLCSLEFETNRPLYDWVVEHTPLEARPHQYEFARLNVDYTVMSKRKLLRLVKESAVSGWDDPRMPTVAGLRRRGVTPEALRTFNEMLGVAKTNIRVDIGKLEFAIRDDLNARAPRTLCVLRPLRVTLTNVEEGDVAWLDAPCFPHDVAAEGSRRVPFSRELLIERDDFAETPPKGWHRLSPGASVRLRHARVIRCDEVVKDEAGGVVELRCSVQPDETRTKGTIHWVSAPHAARCEVRLYDRLFTAPDPEESGEDFREWLNPESLEVLADARIEPAALEAGERLQFERLGYFFRDPVDSTAERPVFNRTVTLRDSWGRRAAAEETEETEGTAARREAARPKAARPEAARREAARPEAQSGESAASPVEIAMREPGTAQWLEDAVAEGASREGAANWIVNELPREARGREAGELPFGARELGELVRLVEEGTLSSSAGREVLAELAESGGSPGDIVARKGLTQVSDREALWPIVEAVLNENPAKVDEYRGGKTGLIGFFVGQVMRKTGGKANPEVVKDLLAGRLG